MSALVVDRTDVEIAASMRSLWAELRDAPAPEVIFCGRVFWTAWRNVIEHRERRRVLLWKYRKLRGMPLPPEPVAV